MKRSPAEVRARFEAALARAMTARDPVLALRRAAGDRALPEELRRALLAAGADGVRMTALLVAKLRFERLLRGSPEAEAWFERAPAAFAAAFRDYHASVRPTAFFPAGEAALWTRHQARRARNSAKHRPPG